MQQAQPPENSSSAPAEAADSPRRRDLAQAGDGPYAILKNRDFVFYLSGRLVALLGQQMFVMALGWEIYDRTGSAMALGLVGLAQLVPMFLFTLPAGHVADNYSRKRVMVLMTAVTAAASLGIATISAFRAPVPWIYLCLFIIGAARTFMWAANAAFLPGLVTRQELPRAVNWNAAMFQLSAITGPAMAGAIIAWLAKGHWMAPAWPIYVFNALAALAFCVLVGMVRREHAVTAKEPMTLRSLLTGFKFVYATKMILGILTLDMFAVFLGGATALLPIYAKDILFVGPAGLGFLRAALPIGSLLCAVALNHRRPLQKAGRAMLWAVAVFGLATVAFGLSRCFWFSLLMLFACGAADTVSVVVRHTLVQLLTPDDKRGRVSAVNNLFIGTSNELGGFESGAVAQVFGPTIGQTIIAGSVISVVSGGIGTMLVVVAVALIWPQIRRYGKLA
jgi:MFS family permease